MRNPPPRNMFSRLKTIHRLLPFVLGLRRCMPVPSLFFSLPSSPPPLFHSIRTLRVSALVPASGTSGPRLLQWLRCNARARMRVLRAQYERHAPPITRTCFVRIFKHVDVRFRQCSYRVNSNDSVIRRNDWEALEISRKILTYVYQERFVTKWNFD